MKGIELVYRAMVIEVLVVFEPIDGVIISEAESNVMITEH